MKVCEISFIRIFYPHVKSMLFLFSQLALFVYFAPFFVWGTVLDSQKPPNVNCSGRVARYTNGEYFVHENSTYRLRISTEVDLSLQLHHVNCIQIGLENIANTTNVASSVFYAVSYEEYAQHYTVTRSFVFGIPEFRSQCKCDCPQSDEFCTPHFDRKFCNDREICYQKYFDNQRTDGCQHRKGSAQLCCKISVRPYLDKKFRGMQLSTHTPDVRLKIDIYVNYNSEWIKFRSYTKHMDPHSVKTLHLNGDENVAEMDIDVSVGPERFSLASDVRQYFYEVGQPFELLERPFRTNIGRSQSDAAYDFLVYQRGSWHLGRGTLSLHDAHRPTVTNCKAQEYTDQYFLNAPTFVIRNNTGALNVRPEPGLPVKEAEKFYVKRTELTENSGVKQVSLYLHQAPSLELKIFLRQKMNIIPHVHVSHFSTFDGLIRLDRYKNRFLNITLYQAFGDFNIIIYKDLEMKLIDVEISSIAKFPFTNNYTDIIPIPNHISEGRKICVKAAESDRKLCKYILFDSEPFVTYTLGHTYIDNLGKCPGCNQETEEGGFLSFLNPRKWLNGVGSFSEGLALALEVGFYVILALVVIAIVRRLIWPLVRWALCASPSYKRGIKKDPSIDAL